MLTNNVITDDGLNWLTLATDPFHDTAIRPCGYPDINSSSTIVQCFTFTTNVAAPVSAGTAPWDAHVFLLPLSALEANTQSSNQAFLNMYGYKTNGGQVTSIASSPGLYAGYNVLTMPTGQDWQSLTPPGPIVTYPAVRYPPTANGGQFRMVAAGFEVVNTTPDLYRGGAVTVFRSPSRIDMNQLMYLNSAGAAALPMTTNQGFLPPSTQANAQLYPTTKTWGAEEGCYSVATISSDRCAFMDASMNCPAFLTPPSNSQLTAGTSLPCFTYGPFIAAQGAGPSATTAQILPFDVHGAMFVGLNTNSTLQVTTRYYIERIPTFSEPDLLVLSRPPTPYDPMARELYSYNIGTTCWSYG
jgi:hypothetical protein